MWRWALESWPEEYIHAQSYIQLQLGYNSFVQVNLGRLISITHKKIHQYICPTKQFSNPMNETGTLSSMKPEPSQPFDSPHNTEHYLPAVEARAFLKLGAIA